MAEPWYRTAFGAFYRCLYAHRNDEEARQCLELLPHLAPLCDRSGAPLLDLGCGDGRHLQGLRERGFAAIGFDLSWPLLRAARERVPSAPLVRGDMRALPFRDASLGAVLSLFTAFGYLGRDGGDASFVADIGRLLRPGAHWFLDYLDVDRLRAELGDTPRRRERTAGPLAVIEARRLEVDAVVKEVRLSPLDGRACEAAALGVGAGGLDYTERVALYTLAELEAMAGAAGLSRVAAAGDYAGAPLGCGPRWLLVYRREGA